MKRYSRVVAFLVILLVTAVLSGMFKEICDSVAVGSTASELPTIILDAGHGGLTNTTH